MSCLLNKIKNSNFLGKFATLLGGTAVVGSLYCLYHGWHESIIIAKSKLPSKILVYKDLQCNSITMTDEFNKVLTLLHSQTFDAPQPVILCFDNPVYVTDKKQMRWAVGFQVDKSEAEKVEEFLKKNEEFQSKELPEVKATKTNQTNCKGGFGFVMKMAYYNEKLLKYAYSNILFGAKVCAIMTFHTDGKNMTGDVAVPYGEKCEEYFLTTKPKPEPKPLGQN